MTRPDDAFDGFDAYKTLQVDSEADPEVIQAAYRRLAQKWHPDVATGPEAAERMVAINRAWEVLGDPENRAAYDRERARADRARERGRTRPADPAWPMERQAPGSASPGASATETRGGGRPASSGTQGAGAAGGPNASGTPPRPPEQVSRDWTTGRSTVGSGYDPASMRKADQTGAAGPPPGQPSGSVLTFGQYSGWSLGEIARSNLEYLEWLDRMTIGRQYRDEIDAILRTAGRRRSAQPEATDRRGLFRRR